MRVINVINGFLLLDNYSMINKAYRIPMFYDRKTKRYLQLNIQVMSICTYYTIKVHQYCSNDAIINVNVKEDVFKEIS